MLWQAIANMRYRTTGGWTLGRQAPPDAFDAFVRSLQSMQSPLGGGGPCTALASSRTSTVLVLDGQGLTEHAIDAVRSLTGVTGRPMGGVVVFPLAGSRCSHL